MGELAGAVCVVTGATGGLGRAIAHRFAEEGARLVVCGTSRERTEELARGLSERGSPVVASAGDVTTDEGASAAADAAHAAFGRIDVLVLNAGAIALGRFWEVSPADFDRVMGVNVRGAWLTARACHHLMPQGSSVVVVGSTSSLRVVAGASVYCVSKAAVLQLGRVMAQDLAPRGIRVNTLAPGTIDEAGMTRDLVDAADDPEAMMRSYVARIPLRRAGTPADVAEAALFLAGPRSSFMTGQALVLDGGSLL